MDSLQNIEATQEAKPGRRLSSMAFLNFCLDVALVVAITLVVWISVMLQFVFPAPTTAGGWTLWGLSYDQWRDVQFYSLCVFTLLALEHVVLHWNWICSIIVTKVLRLKNRPDKELLAVYGVGALIGILLTILASLIVAILTIQGPQR